MNEKGCVKSQIEYDSCDVCQNLLCMCIRYLVLLMVLYRYTVYPDLWFGGDFFKLCSIHEIETQMGNMPNTLSPKRISFKGEKFFGSTIFTQL